MASHRDGWVTLGLAVSALSAAVSSFAGLRGLAMTAGWPVWLAWLLPLTVDAYGMTATRVWLAASTRSARARRFARTNAVGAILLSLTGNAVYHLIAVRLVATSWVVVVAVGAVPALVLGLVSHLAVLRTQVDESRPQDGARIEDGPRVTLVVPRLADLGPPPSSGPSLEAEDGPRYTTEDELYEAARVADAAHRAAHAARPITRDALRQTLRIGGTQATAIARRLKQEHEAAITAMPNKALEAD